MAIADVPPGHPWTPGHEHDLHHVGPPRVSFSRVEFLHLAGAVLVLSYAFALVQRGNPGHLTLVPDWVDLLAALPAAATAFILHELAHKVVAQRYGHWAEFRANFPMLGLALLMAMLTGFLFALPGAVLIQGRVTHRENGIISLVGPGMNVVVALACLPFFAFDVNQDGLADRIFATVAWVNAVLSLFNLLPIGVLDGRKVWRWNKPVYVVALVVSLALCVFTIQQAAVL